jgi:tRNA (guanine-N7-)-methyltransferase
MRRLPTEELQSYLIDIAHPKAPDSASVEPSGSPPRPLNLGVIFGNDHPVELEVGFGKGMFLVSASQAHPETNYLGIEIERAYQLYAANRLGKRKLTNVRLACGDARAFLRDHFPDRCLQAVHVYFPDPWWKQRHRKRRLFNEDFAGQCVRVLRDGGRLNLASDVAEYFAEIQKMLCRHQSLLPLPVAEAMAPRHDLDYLTNFERKYRKAARPIYRAVYERDG